MKNSFQSINRNSAAHSESGLPSAPESENSTSTLISGAEDSSNTSMSTSDSNGVPTSVEALFNVLHTSLQSQLQNFNNALHTRAADKSTQNILIEYLHKKMEQDAELNSMFVATMERIVKCQADAQVESVKILEKCATLLENFTPKKDTAETNDQNSG